MHPGDAPPCLSGWEMERSGPSPDCRGGLDIWKASRYAREHPFSFTERRGPQLPCAGNTHLTSKQVRLLNRRPPCSWRCPCASPPARRLRAQQDAARQLYNSIPEGCAATVAPHARRSRLAERARHSPHAEVGTKARFWRAPTALWHYPSYALHQASKGLNGSWIAEHVDAVLAQTLATRGHFRNARRFEPHLAGLTLRLESSRLRCHPLVRTPGTPRERLPALAGGLVSF
jgi:hypothetical protein